MAKRETRLPVRKTYKLFLGGKFVRVENGRAVAATNAAREVLANYARASPKDFRDAVVAARAAFPGWSLRGQILYRAAEVLESRSEELASELAQAGSTARSAAPGSQRLRRTAGLLRGLDGQIRASVGFGESGGVVAF